MEALHLPDNIKVHFAGMEKLVQYQIIHTLGVALVMEGEHLCKSMRGAKKKGKMKSSYLVGAFKDDAQLRNEFFNLIK
mgnify:CR=1 FL=1